DGAVPRPRGDRPGAERRDAPTGRAPSALDRLPGLEERLQVVDDRLPAARDAGGRLRRALEAVVRDAQQARAVALRDDVPRDAALLLERKLRVVERAPAVDEAPRRVELLDVGVAPRVAVRPEARVVVGDDGDPRAVEVLRGPFGFRDRVPDLLRCRPDRHLVDLRRERGLGAHRRSSRRYLRSTSADTWRSVYLSIQRAW